VALKQQLRQNCDMLWIRANFNPDEINRGLVPSWGYNSFTETRLFEKDDLKKRPPKIDGVKHV